MNRSSVHSRGWLCSLRLTTVILLASALSTAMSACGGEGYYDGTGAYEPIPPRTGVSANEDMSFFFKDNMKEGADAVGVYYVLLRDCAFPACHASQDRFFRIFGPGRARIPGRDFDADVYVQEALLARVSALEFVDPDNPSQSPLLRKPLSVSAGGAGHGGVDNFGRDVYSSITDEGYRALRRWVEDGAVDPKGPDEL